MADRPAVQFPAALPRVVIGLEVSEPADLVLGLALVAVRGWERVPGAAEAEELVVDIDRSPA